MNRDSLKPGLEVSIEEKGGANASYYKATIVSVDKRRTDSNYALTTVEIRPEGSTTTRHVTSTKVKGLWVDHERDERRRAHERHLLEVGRKALEAERTATMKRTVAAGFNTIQVSSEPDTGVVLVRFDTWNEVLDRLEAKAGRK